MKYSILTLVLAAGSVLPGAYAQVQSNTTAEHREEHSATQVAPDGTEVQRKATANERTESTNNGDGSSTTTRSRQTSRKTEVKKEVAPPPPPAPAATVESEHHSSTTTTTDTTVKQ